MGHRGVLRTTCRLWPGLWGKWGQCPSLRWSPSSRAGFAGGADELSLARVETEGVWDVQVGRPRGCWLFRLGAQGRLRAPAGVMAAPAYGRKVLRASELTQEGLESAKKAQE